jgi:hypothetical protein
MTLKLFIILYEAVNKDGKKYPLKKHILMFNKKLVD